MVCRLCFSHSEEYIDIFSEEKISKYIKQFLELEIIEEDPISKVICGVCWEQIKVFQIFYMQIKEAQRRPLMKLKKESVDVDKELTPIIVESTLEYNINNEADDQDLDETAGSTTQHEEELAESIMTETKDNLMLPAISSPNHTKKKSRHSKKLSKTTRSFKNEGERKFFVELMKKEEVIWNRTHTLHSSSRALTEAWKRISMSMLTPKTVHECKVMWKSLRDALRYERRKAANGYDQGDDLRNLLYFISPSNGQKKIKNPIACQQKESEFFNGGVGGISVVLSKIPGKSKVETKKKYKIQNYHLFDGPNAQWSQPRTCDSASGAWTERICENNVSCYADDGPSKHFSNNNSSFETITDRPHSTAGVFTITNPNSSSMGHMNDPSPVDYKSASNAFYNDVKSEYKGEVSDLVESISKALNRLVTIATSHVQTKSNCTDFKYEYIWKLIECLYAQMDQTTINDLNQRIINMVYEGCKINVY